MGVKHYSPMVQASGEDIYHADAHISRQPSCRAGPLWAALLLIAGLAGLAVQAPWKSRLHDQRIRAATAETVEEQTVSRLVLDHAVHGGCLCLFDVDRTLTAKQGTNLSDCRGVVETDIYDPAFGGGKLALSALGDNPAQTECGTCRKGVISAGGVGGPDEKAMIAEKLGAVGNWSGPDAILGSVIFGCPDGVKHVCASGIIDWYLRTHNVEIRPRDVYFFDDLAFNVNGFGGLGMNAHQVSCASRDGSHGLCGGSLAEVRLRKGISFCK